MTTTDDISDRSFLIATGNPGKCREFEKLLEDFFSPAWQIYDRASFPAAIPDVEETGETYRENALKKAVESARATGCCALADDSGLDVDALGGEPGVRSARFAGEHATDEENNRLLLERLQGVSPQERTARFVAVVALALPDNEVAEGLLDRCGISRGDIDGDGRKPGQFFEVDGVVALWFRGVLEGRITEEPAGEEGFGYDPFFEVPSLGRTLAELPPARKNGLSHRAEATRRLTGFFHD